MVLLSILRILCECAKRELVAAADGKLPCCSNVVLIAGVLPSSTHIIAGCLRGVVSFTASRDLPPIPDIPPGAPFTGFTAFTAFTAYT